MNEDFLMFFPNVTPQKLFRPRNLAIEVGLRITIRDVCISGSTQLNPILRFISFSVLLNNVTLVSLRELSLSSFPFVISCVPLCMPLIYS